MYLKIMHKYSSHHCFFGIRVLGCIATKLSTHIHSCLQVAYPPVCGLRIQKIDVHNYVTINKSAATFPNEVIKTNVWNVVIY